MQEDDIADREICLLRDSLSESVKDRSHIPGLYDQSLHKTLESG
jgi:hypothetical protein